MGLTQWTEGEGLPTERRAWLQRGGPPRLLLKALGSGATLRPSTPLSPRAEVSTPGGQHDLRQCSLMGPEGLGPVCERTVLKWPQAVARAPQPHHGAQQSLDLLTIAH